MCSCRKNTHPFYSSTIHFQICFVINEKPIFSKGLVALIFYFVKWKSSFIALFTLFSFVFVNVTFRRMTFRYHFSLSMFIFSPCLRLIILTLYINVSKYPNRMNVLSIGHKHWMDFNYSSAPPFTHSHSLASFLLSFLEWCKCTASKYHTTTIVKMANKSPPVPVS